MIRWKDIEVDDKGIIDSYYKRYNSEVSDYSFTQLLLWVKPIIFSMQKWKVF